MGSNEYDFAGQADEYEGAWDAEETSDEGTESQDAESAGEPAEPGSEDESPEVPEGAADVDEPIYEVTLPGGQKVEVPLSELVSGYTRTADYTRKTQALAAQRKQLADAEALALALERNPQQALAALARAYGVQQGEFQEPEEEYLSDEDRWRRTVESELAEVRRSKQEAHIEREINRLHHAYGDFDEESLFTYAVQTNTMNLEIALQAMQFASLREQAAAKTAQRTQTKRAVSAAQGNRPAAASKPVVDDGEISSFKDAYQYAKRVLDQS